MKNRIQIILDDLEATAKDDLHGLASHKLPMGRRLDIKFFGNHYRYELVNVLLGTASVIERNRAENILKIVAENK